MSLPGATMQTCKTISCHQDLVLNLNLLDLCALRILGLIPTLNVLFRLRRSSLFSPAIQALRLEQVQVQRERPGNDEADERDEESVLSADGVGDGAKNRREECATADGRNDETGTTLAVSTQSTEGECEDERENARLEEENQRDRRDTRVTLETHDQAREQHNAGEESHEDETRLGELEQTTGDESTDSETSLRDSEEVRARGVRRAWSDCRNVVDEVAGIRTLRANVAELGEHAKEEGVLFLEGLVLEIGLCAGRSGLGGHVAICDFRDGSEEEDDGEEEDEDCDAEVDPLDGLERGLVDGFEDDLAGEDGCDDGSYGLEGLGESETEL